MSRMLRWWWVGGWVVVGLGLTGWYFFQSRPTHLSGNAWDYALRPDELSDVWTLSAEDVTTAYDLAQTSEPPAPLTPSVSLTNLREVYAADYGGAESSDYIRLTFQILLYETEADASASLTTEDPGPEWESITVATVGTATRAWRFINPPDDPSLDQTIYRVNFQYLNSVSSIVLWGTGQAAPNPNELIQYARQISNKMRANATPPELKQLQNRRLPDVRAVLLSQIQLAQLDSYLGQRWRVDARSVPTWTPNASFGSPETATALQQLGRLTGYQMFLVKSLTTDEVKQDLPLSLFQQLTIYQSPEAAQTGLGQMTGLEQVIETPLVTPVGEAARYWGALAATTQNDDTRVTVAIHEIDFRVGAYVGSIRLQTRALSAGEADAALAASGQLARQLAEALAANVQAVEEN